jgi:hypothetical protein
VPSDPIPSDPIFVGIPILNRADLLARCLDSIDHPAHVLVVNNNTVDERFNDQLWKLGSARGLEVADQARNLGIAASWNLILKTGMARGFELIMIGSNDVLLSPGSLARVQSYPKQEREVIWHIHAWNFFAIHRRAVAHVGWFDENFYPAYKEDQDYMYRCMLAGAERVSTDEIGGGSEHLGSQTIHSDPHYYACNEDTHLRWNLSYYLDKWGGDFGAERYTTPFGDARRDWRWWPPPGPSIAERDWDRDRRRRHPPAAR